MSAPGQDAGNGAAGGAQQGAASGTPPPGQQQGQQPADPWTGVIDGAPEHVRPFVEQALTPLREQLTPQLELAQRLEPLGEHADTLLELLSDSDEENGSNQLAGLLEFYAMTGDENRVDDFYGWWDRVGESYGFFGEEGGEPGQGEPAGEGAGAAAAGDPRDSVISELRETITELTQRLDGVESNGRVSEARTRVQTQLNTLMEQHKIEDNQPDEQGNSNRATILRLAAGYGPVPNAVELAVGDYLRLTGQAQGELVAASGGRMEGGAGGGGSRPGAALGGGQPPTEPEPVASWEDARRQAMQRLTAPSG